MNTLVSQKTEILKYLLNYPNLEQTFSSEEPNRLLNLNNRIKEKLTSLERSLMDCGSDEKMKIEKIKLAYLTTQKFLSELENLQKSNLAN